MNSELTTGNLQNLGSISSTSNSAAIAAVAAALAAHEATSANAHGVSETINTLNVPTQLSVAGGVTVSSIPNSAGVSFAYDSVNSPPTFGGQLTGVQVI